MGWSWPPATTVASDARTPAPLRREECRGPTGVPVPITSGSRSVEPSVSSTLLASQVLVLLSQAAVREARVSLMKDFPDQ